METWSDISRENLVRTIKKQALMIDYLYDSLGPANDDILDMAYDYAEENVDDEL